MPKLRHIAIITLDPERLADFYQDVFEMKLLHRSPGGGIYLTDGHINLAILRNRAEGKPSGINHIGFHVEDEEELERRLEKWQIAAPGERPANRPYAEKRATDPDGNNIDLSVHGFEAVELKSDRDTGKNIEEEKETEKV